MSDAFEIRLSGVGKMYKMFGSRSDSFLEALGLGRMLPWHRVKYTEFWALKGVDLTLGPGERIGIIGRNGAGKSTLLKLITGNVLPTEGIVEVNGNVQALLDAGAGLHPEFTGYENIRAALVHQGLDDEGIEAATRDIAEFTELGVFLSQPFKTYSLGMQARLGFAIATCVEPEILIVDEVLGAGDAYFFGKSTARMRELVEGGASVLIVSHALDQILRFCDQAIWLDRGRVVERGPTLDVVKAYEEFVRRLEDRRLQAKNRKLRSPGYDPASYDLYADSLAVKLTVAGPPGAFCDVADVRLLRDGRVEDFLAVGDAQDVDGTQSAHVLASERGWSPPRTADRPFRRLEVNGQDVVSGEIRFHIYAIAPESAYTVDARIRSGGGAGVRIDVFRNGALAASTPVTPPADWTDIPLRLPTTGPAEARAVESVGHRRSAPLAAASKPWPGQGALTLESLVLVGSDGEESAVFEVGTRLRLRGMIVAHADGRFPVVPVAVLFRLDGVLVTRLVGEQVELDMRTGDRHPVELEVETLNLGNATYVFSVGLYRSLDLDNVEAPELYDLIDRSHEFQVVGNRPLLDGVFRHPGAWRIG